MQRGENVGVALTAGGGHRGDQLADAGDLRGNRRHQHGGRIRGLAAWHVDADAVQGRDALAQPIAVFVLVLEAAGRLALVVVANPPGGVFEGLPVRCGKRVQRILQFLGVELQVRRVVHLETVVLAGQPQQRGVAFVAHRIDDAGGFPDDGLGLSRVPRQEARQLVLESRLRSAQTPNRRRHRASAGVLALIVTAWMAPEAMRSSMAA